MRTCPATPEIPIYLAAIGPKNVSLAAEVAPGVTVLAVNPGVVATEMLATCFQADVSGYTPPETCAAQLVRLLQTVEPGWNGRSVDATDF